MLWGAWGRVSELLQRTAGRTLGGHGAGGGGRLFSDSDSFGGLGPKCLGDSVGARGACKP